MLCTICGEAIAEKRKAALPHTTHCVECASEVVSRVKFSDLSGAVTVQHTGGLHEKYLKEEDI